MKTFKKTYLEITTACNLSCSFCPGTSRKSQFMSEELFEKILAKLTGHSKHLYLHVLGEPLLHPQLGLFLDRCHGKGLLVNLTTNGVLINEVAEMLISKPALRQVSFSLHSYDPEANLLSLDDYLEKIFAFIRDTTRTRKLFVSLKLWNTLPGGKDANDLVLKRIEHEFGISQPLQNQPSSKGVQVAEGIFLNQALPFAWPSLKGADVGDKGFCLGLRDQIAILVDGTVVPCCLDAEGVMNLGNLAEDSLENILETSRSRAIYDGFSRRAVVEPLCRTCAYRTRFGS